MSPEQRDELVRELMCVEGKFYNGDEFYDCAEDHRWWPGAKRLTHDATFGTLVDVLGGFDAAYEAEGFAHYDEQVAAGNQQVRKAIERNLGVESGETLRDWLRQTAAGYRIVRDEEQRNDHDN